jgi:hypothetical protein
MRRVLLVLIVLIPLAVMAQEKSPPPAEYLSVAAVSAQGDASPTDDKTASGQTDIGADLGLSANTLQQPSANAPQEPGAKPRHSPKPKGEPKHKIPLSMVGYIDNPIPESQVRIRFDAAFHDNSPDRAEFFYAQCGCSGGPGPVQGQPGKDIVTDLNFQQLYLRAEYAPIRRFSIFTEIPFRWIQPQAFINPLTPQTFGNQAGISDVQAGFKFAALASSSHYLTLQLQGYFPSGNSHLGLGTHHYSIGPEVLYYQRLSGRSTLEAMVGDFHPIGGSKLNGQGYAGDVFVYGVGPSYVLYNGEHLQFAPVIELVAWHVFGGLETVPSPPAADGINIANLKAGARTTFGTHNSIYIGYGHQLTHNVWYKEIVRVEYRYLF